MDLDVGGLLRDGWRPTPFRQFILKIHSRCNLACDYCYMYEMADQGWRDQPRRMTRATISLITSRIAEHVRTHRIPEIDLVLHGGEPLLAGVELIRYAVTSLRSSVGPETSVNV